MSDRIVNAPDPVVFKDDEGKEHAFRLSALNDRDIVELDNWVRMRYLQLVRESMRRDDGMREDEKDRAERIAQREAQSLTWTSGMGARIMGTVDGMVQMVWQSAKRCHPKVQPEELRHLMLNEANIAEANAAFARLNLGKRMVKKGPQTQRERKPRGKKSTSS